MIETTAVVTLVVGLTEVFKKGFKMPSRLAPLLSLVFALVLTISFGTSDLADKVFTGIMIGLSASGLYSGTKKTLNLSTSKKTKK